MDDAAKLTNSACQAAGQGDFVTALSLLRRALDAAPRYMPALINLGNVLADSGDADEASAAYSRALEIEPRSFEARANAGMHASEHGRPEEAIAHLRVAVEIDANYGDGLYNLANLICEQDPVEAAVLYERALALSPSDVDILCNLASCLSELGRFDDGERHAAEARKLWPQHAGASRQHAAMLMQLGRHGEALQAARVALAIDSANKASDHETHALLFELLRASDTPRAAVPHLQTACKCAPSAEKRLEYTMRLLLFLAELGEGLLADKVGLALLEKLGGSMHDAALLRAIQGGGTPVPESGMPTVAIQDTLGKLVPLALTEARLPGGKILTHKAKLATLLENAGFVHLIPHTKLVHSASDLRSELAHAVAELGQGRHLYFLKHPGVQRGNGLCLFTSDDLEPAEKFLGDTMREDAVVLQRCVAPPFLLEDGRKFALRLYLILVLPRELDKVVGWLHHEAVLLGAGAACTDEADELAHVAKPLWVSTRHASGKTKTLNRLKGLASDLWDGYAACQSAIHDLFRDVLEAAQSSLVAASTFECGQRSTTFQLFGADIVLDASARPYLLELNAGPQLSDTLRFKSHLRERLGLHLLCSLPELVARSSSADGGECDGWHKL